VALNQAVKGVEKVSDCGQNRPLNSKILVVAYGE